MTTACSCKRGAMRCDALTGVGDAVLWLVLARDEQRGLAPHQLQCSAVCTATHAQHMPGKYVCMWYCPDSAPSRCACTGQVIAHACMHMQRGV